MAGQFGSVGAAFNQGMENVLFEQAKADHEREKQRIEAEREARQAQAQMDAHIEHQQNLLEHQHEFEEKAYDAKVKRWFQQNGNMVRGDRPSPEQESSAKELGINVFRQAPAAVSTQPMQPPAALMEAPPAGAPAEGAPAPEPINVAGQGPLAAPQVYYPGTLAEQQKADKEERVKALIAKASALSDRPTKAEVIPIAMEAHELGVPVDALLKGGAGGGGAKRQIIYDPTATPEAPHGTLTDAISGQPIDPSTMSPDEAAHIINRQVPSTVAQGNLEERRKMDIAHTVENVNAGIEKATHGITERAGNLKRLDDMLAQGTNQSYSLIARQAIAALEGGVGSGIRVTDQGLQSMMTGPRSAYENLQIMINKWNGATPEQQNGNLFYTDQQIKDLKSAARAIKEDIIEQRKLADDYRDKATKVTDPMEALKLLSEFNAKYTDLLNTPIKTPAEKKAAAAAPKTSPTGPASYGKNAKGQTTITFGKP